ncbi:MAG: TonB-dependent receptor [Edaphobacter sp.]|uniref:TonB-dependent receptor n=1 Tax=Edaphobacter sp. TaxID=1934404 RepID=UPI002385E200|nr:carboxypeptidase regulatory-like domain-containing protein [Edaphobacter sp.]MDE1175822.1 TonB-dependent receptor [Edaphobacter sp.]
MKCSWNFWTRYVCLMMLTVALVKPSFAQNTTADVVGTVTDSSGAVVPGATIELTNTDTQEKRVVTSGAGGEYTFTLLKPSRYSLSVTAAGFKVFVINSFALAAGDRAREDSHLEIGGTGEVVNVDAAPPSLHTDTSALITTVTEKATQELPLNGRNFINLVQVTPGATEGLNNGLASGNRPDDRRQTSSVSVNGQADMMNNQLVDGMDNNERVIGSIGVRPSVDAIQEVSVQTNVFTAEVGRSAGAIINVITKSGTNQYHGTAYEFFRNDVLNASPYKFGANIPKPKYRQNQFGGSLGGPIIKDKTFFFADYEGLNIVRTLNPTTTTVPTRFERNNPGNFTDNPAINKIVPASSFDNIGQQYMALFPLPTNDGVLSGNYVGAPRNSQFNKTADGRLDHRFRNGDLAYLRYTYNAVDTNIGSLFPLTNSAAGQIYPGGNLGSYPGPAQTRAHQAQLNYIHSFTPNLLLELKAGYTLLDNAQYPLNFGNAINTAMGQPNINVDSRTAALSAVTVNQGTATTLGNRPPIIYHENTFQYEGTVNYIHGKQAIKIGAGLIRRQDSVTQTDTANGNWSFTDFSTLLSGDYINEGRNEILFTPHNRTWEPHFFFQDDVHLTSRLTVNLGVRYDLFTPYTEINNILSNFDTGLGKIVVAGQNGIDGHGNIRTDYSNFAPRIGFAYTPAERTVIRGGFGMTYAPENTTSGSALVNQPFTATWGAYTPDQAYNTAVGPLYNYSPAAATAFRKFAGGLPSPVPNSATNPSGTVTAALDPHFRSTYIEQFNLTVEREFAGFVGSVSYVGQLGRRLAYYLNDYNTLAPTASIYANPNDTTTNTPVIANAGFNSLRRFASTVPNITTIPYYTSNGISSYHAMQAVLKRRFNKGLDLQVGYTWARLLDDAESISNNGGNGFGTSAELIPTIDYGNGNLDVRQRVTMTFNYSLPFGESKHGFTGALVKGWQANGLVVWNTGMPFSVINTINRTGTRPSAGTSDRPNMIGSGKTSNPSVSRWFDVNDFAFQKVGTIGTERRNQLYGPGLQRVDLSLFKNFDITERLKLEFRTEAFNVLNTTQFANPNGTLSLTPCTVSAPCSGTYPVPGFQPVSTFGTITATANAYNPRLIQFAARLKF